MYLALNVFERRRSFKRLPDSLQRDIAVFWGSYPAAQAEATKLLFSLGKAEVIKEACGAAAAGGVWAPRASNCCSFIHRWCLDYPRCFAPMWGVRLGSTARSRRRTW